MRRAWPASASYFFALSQRRPSDDGKFNGIVSVAVLPSYFEDFYANMGRSEGSYFGMARADGGFLARFPVPKDRLHQARRAQPIPRSASRAGSTATSYSVDSQLDGIDRRIGYRKLTGFPVYVLAGVEKSAIVHEWLSLYEQPSDLRPAGDRVPLCRPRAGIAAHQAALRRSRPPRGGGRRAAPVAAAGSDRPIDRRRRARLQQPADDHQRQRAAAARRSDRQEAHPAARHDRRRRPSAAKA